MQCGSADTTKLSLIWQSGNAVIHAKTTGVDIGSGIGFGTAFTTGSAQSLSSLRASPPEKMQVIRPVLVYFFINLIVYVAVSSIFSLPSWLDLILNWVWLPPSAWHLYKSIRYNRFQYPRLLRQWSQCFHCNRCGTIFLPTQNQGVNS